VCVCVAPDRPGDLSFIVTTPTSVLVSWSGPSPRPNGVVLLYELSYYQDVHVDGNNYSHSIVLYCALVDTQISLLGPFYGAIAVPSVTHWRCRCGHRFYIAIHQVSLLSHAACAML